MRETEILVEQQPPQGVLVCDHAGLVINKLSYEETRHCSAKRCNRKATLEATQGQIFKSISHRCYLFDAAFLWELTTEIVDLPLGCLQGGEGTRHSSAKRCNRKESWRAARRNGSYTDATSGPLSCSTVALGERMESS